MYDFLEEYYYAGVDLARRCNAHPNVRISSDDGLFDGVCHICEGESFDAAEMWAYDSANTEREHCFLPVSYMPISSTVPWTCNDLPIPEDDIPF